MSSRVKSLFLCGVTVVLGGALRLPLESGHEGAMKRAKLLPEPVGLELRDELGQSAFLAVLGGLRGPVASFTEIQAIGEWQECNYGIVDSRYALCNKLQPEEAHYWEQRAQMAGVNAVHNLKYNLSLDPGLLRMRVIQQVDKGVEVLLEGVKYCPRAANLYEKLAHLYQDPNNFRRPDYRLVAEAWRKASECEGVPRFYRHMYGYALARVPGKELEAWRVVSELYADRTRRTPRMEQVLAFLYPAVLKWDASALLPVELMGRAEALRRKEEKFFMERREGPRVSTPNLQQRVPVPPKP